MKKTTATPHKFKTACFIAGFSMRDFAKQIGCSITMLSLVVAGKRKSRRISAACEQLVKKEFKKILQQARGGVSAQAAHGNPINQITPRVLKINRRKDEF